MTGQQQQTARAPTTQRGEEGDCDFPELPLTPRLRLAMLYRLGRTSTILRSFGDERRKAAAAAKEKK